ncbi:hypothetical protein FACS189431_8210 [Alphaproteobacteria bacterium]|nr:hypothetical protein FACS189431_8210 [Alphaproteobacteria bacterium]
MIYMNSQATGEPVAKEILAYDVDGVLTSPSEKRLVYDEIVHHIADQMREGAQVVFNTGRSTSWVERIVLPGLIAALGESIKYLSNLCIIGEKGNAYTAFDQDGTPRRDQLPGGVPDGLKQAVLKLAGQYDDIMGNLEPKSTMLSLEMLDGVAIADYQAQRGPFIKAVKELVSGNPVWSQAFRVDATTIAVDIEPCDAGKAKGIKRFLQILEERGIDYSSAIFKVFGDSPSDIAMAYEMTNAGLKGVFVYVGDDIKALPPVDSLNVINVGGFDAGTLSYLARGA